MGCARVKFARTTPSRSRDIASLGTGNEECNRGENRVAEAEFGLGSEGAGFKIASRRVSCAVSQDVSPHAGEQSV
eukprot:220961-Prymnesium_polylepis.1